MTRDRRLHPGLWFQIFCLTGSLEAAQKETAQHLNLHWMTKVGVTIASLVHQQILSVWMPCTFIQSRSFHQREQLIFLCLCPLLHILCLLEHHIVHISLHLCFLSTRRQWCCLEQTAGGFIISGGLHQLQKDLGGPHHSFWPGKAQRASESSSRELG